jgi:septal ring factor EnvC (AmiA/AmiB activator)
MTSLAYLRRLPQIGAACLSLACAACSVEQTTNRCTADSMSLEDLIQCVRKTYAETRQCDAGRHDATAVPVAGRRVIKFGEVTKHGGTSRGIVFETGQGAEVRAPMSGLVTFADPWRSYGDLLIIDSCATVALLAGSFSPEVIAGQNAAAGSTVAKMRQTATGTPVLYLELRENGATIDPAAMIPES